MADPGQTGDRGAGKADHRPNTYLETGEDGVQRRIWRASSLGACERSLVLDGMGRIDRQPVPDNIQRAFDEGSAAERKILRRWMDDRGWRTRVPHEVLNQWGTVDPRTDQVVVELACGRWKGVEQVVRCHPDDIALRYIAGTTVGGVDGGETGTTRVVEIKHLMPESSGGDPHKALVGSPFYRWQTSVEMVATGLGLAWVVGWKKRGEDGQAQVSGVEARYYDEPVYSYGQIKGRVLRLAKKLWDAEDAGLGDIDCDWKMWPCGYYQGGCQQPERAPEELDKETAGRITALALEINQCIEREKVQKEKKDRAKAQMLELMRGLGWDGGTRRVGSWDIQWQEIDARDAWEETKTVKHKAREASDKIVVKHAAMNERDD